MGAVRQQGPRLELDWEERAFTGLRALWRRWRPDPAETAGLPVEPLLAHLTPLAQLAAGWPCRVGLARGSGGLLPDGILLPERVDHPDELEDLPAWCWLGGRMLANADQDHPRGPLDAGRRLAASLEDARRARTELAAQWPGFLRMITRRERSWLEADQGSVTDAAARARREALQDLAGGACPRSSAVARPSAVQRPCWPEWLAAAPPDDQPGIPDSFEKAQPSAGTERQLPLSGDSERVRLDKRDLEEQTLQHIFEKVQTADEYRGGTRQLDGSDELDEQLDALREVDLRHVIRGGAAADSLLRAELRLDPGIPDAADEEEGAGIPYDEWDSRAGTYRRGWCRVLPGIPAAKDPAWAADRLAALAPVTSRLRDELERLRARPLADPRQDDGEAVDVDAFADDQGSLRARRAGSGRWYVKDRRQRPELALTLLLDISLSSDGWTGGKRVLDLCREAALALAEASRLAGGEIELLAFHSNTRHRCRVWTVLERGGDTRAGLERLGALEPRGYTRVGPALRHATAGLAARRERRRLLLVLTDGRPTDFDRYEGRHGIGDVRQAVREAQARAVRIHALAVDPAARATLPAQFGEGGWSLLRHPDELPGRLAGLLAWAHR